MFENKFLSLKFMKIYQRRLRAEDRNRKEIGKLEWTNWMRGNKRVQETAVNEVQYSKGISNKLLQRKQI